ncbi:MAG: M15 family metallopeptidase [Eubacterium sp.]|nr:M15 family metallopeptidase [Eubacterium sp.]
MGNNEFVKWLKHRWRLITVRDGLYFRFIWTTAIAITLVTVLVSAGLTAAEIKKEEKAVAEEAERQKASEEAARLEAIEKEMEAKKATDTDALPWNLIYVSATHKLPKDFKVPEFTELVNGHQVDSRIYPDLQKMFDDARAAGFSPTITSSYIEFKDQEDQLKEKIDELVEEGKTQEQAEVEAKAFVADSGTNEHETGLAIDVDAEEVEEESESEEDEEDEEVDEAEDGENEGEENTEEKGDKEEDVHKKLWKWLEDNSYKYGFIVRYPANKSSITGVTSEEKHLRYVGVKEATEMHKSGICLEEYLGVTK